MLKIAKKIQFSSGENRMNSIANTKIARDLYYSSQNLNVKFLLEKRFSWMNEFINENDKGIEVGSGAGFTKDFIKNKNLKLKAQLFSDNGKESFEHELTGREADASFIGKSVAEKLLNMAGEKFKKK